jgi:hypothetical protein
MWKCQQCGEEVEDTFNICWNCSTGKDGTPFVEELYKRAHDLHHMSHNLDRAMELYKQIIEQFPESPEAQHARTQIESIEEAIASQEAREEPPRHRFDNGKNANEPQVDEQSSISQHQNVPKSLMTRYADAYLVAQTQTAIGGVIKTIGIILGVIIFLTGLVMLTQIDGIARVGVILSSAVLAIAVGVPLYVLGIHASAQGQILKAILDGTVTSSPFLTEEQMKQVMSLR